jgi:hypothetical protein
VGFLIAEVARAATAIPAERVQDAESRLKNALIELKMQESLKETFVRKAREESDFNFLSMAGKGFRNGVSLQRYCFGKTHPSLMG